MKLMDVIWEDLQVNPGCCAFCLMQTLKALKGMVVHHLGLPAFAPPAIRGSLSPREKPRFLRLVTGVAVSSQLKHRQVRVYLSTADK